MGKVARLTKPIDFRNVYKNGKVLKEGVLCIHLLQTPAKQTKAGVSIRSRVIKKAVDRNRLRRVIYEWLSHNLQGKLQTACSLVVVVRRQISTGKRGSEAVRRALGDALARLENETDFNKDN